MFYLGECAEKLQKDSDINEGIDLFPDLKSSKVTFDPSRSSLEIYYISLFNMLLLNS